MKVFIGRTGQDANDKEHGEEDISNNEIKQKGAKQKINKWNTRKNIKARNCFSRGAQNRAPK